jgi:hypothetical protein
MVRRGALRRVVIIPWGVVNKKGFRFLAQALEHVANVLRGEDNNVNLFVVSKEPPKTLNHEKSKQNN